MDGVRVHPLLSLAKTTNTATAATAATASATTNDGLPAHRFELQSIDVLRSSVAGSYRIAAVDALGHVSVSSVTVGPPTASDSKTQVQTPSVIISDSGTDCMCDLCCVAIGFTIGYGDRFTGESARKRMVWCCVASDQPTAGRNRQSFRSDDRSVRRQSYVECRR